MIEVLFELMIAHRWRFENETIKSTSICLRPMGEIIEYGTQARLDK
jgi:hypothetical protein